MELANRANNKFNPDLEGMDEDLVIDNMAEATPYEKPTEVFMPHKIQE